MTGRMVNAMSAWTQVVPWIISLLMLIFSILAFARTGRKDKTEEREADRTELMNIKESTLKANMKLDQLNIVVADIRADIKAMNIQLNDMDKEVAIVKQDLNTAFIRIDELKDKVSQIEKGENRHDDK